MEVKTEAKGLSVWFGDCPPASAQLSLIYHESGKARIRHLSLLDLTAISDPETGLAGAEIVDLMGRFIARLEAIPDAPRSD